MLNSLVLNLRIESGNIKHCSVLILDQLLHHACQVNITFLILVTIITLLLTGVLTGSEPEEVQDGSGKMIHGLTNLISPITIHISDCGLITWFKIMFKNCLMNDPNVNCGAQLDFQIFQFWSH